MSALIINKLKLCFSLFLCFNIYMSDSLRILGIFPLQMKSHYIMCDELMKGLTAKGHQVDVYSHYPPKEPIPNCRHFNLKGTIPEWSSNMTFESAREMVGVKIFQSSLNEALDAMCGLIEKPIFQKLLDRSPKNPTYDLLILELSAVYCYLPWGAHLNASIIGIVTTSLSEWHYEPFGNPVNYAHNVCQHCPYAPPMTLFERFDNFFNFKYMEYNFKRYIIDKLDKSITKVFGPGMPSLPNLVKSISLVLVNEDIALNGVKPYTPAVVPVGGLHIVDRNKTLSMVVQKWLDESAHGCIYFSFGSMLRIETFPRHVIDVFYRSIENIAPVRVLMKIASPEALPPGLPSNVLTQPWFEQMQILKHKNVKAFVTHGGLMGSQEAIYYGVPMVGVPVFGDQLSNVAWFSKKNIAVKVDVDHITEETFTHALNEALNNKLIRQNVERASKQFRDRLASPLDTAIYWVEYVHKYGKDALRSPLLDMPWWQAYQLDIHGLLILVTISIIYILTFVLMKFLKFFYQKLYYKSHLKVKKN